MADQRALAAVRRIERALARLEAADSTPMQAAVTDNEEMDRLRSAHAQLRREVNGAIGHIDKLILAGQSG